MTIGRQQAPRPRPKVKPMIRTFNPDHLLEVPRPVGCIVTGNILFQSSYETYLRKRLIPLMKRQGIVPRGSNPNMGLIAWVAQGRWSITCPCGGGEYAFDEGWVMCASCWNEWADHYYVRTFFPKFRREIEDILMCRVHREERNYRPREILPELLAQNLEHGDRIP